MIVGCYTLDLYCDCERVNDTTGQCGCGVRHLAYDYFRVVSQYTGRNERECLRQAKRDGWKISKGTVTCPLCRK